MIAADDLEAHDVAFVVEDLEELGAGLRRHAGDDADFPERAHFAVADDDVAALEEVLVGLGIVEAADDRPDGGDGGGDGLDDGGAALVGGHGVGVVAGDGVGDGERDAPCGLGVFVAAGSSGGCGGAGGGGVDSVEVK